MLQKLEITGVHYKVDDKLHKYIMRKIGGLDRYVSRHARESVHAEIFLKESKTRDNQHCHFEIIVHLPHDTITLTEKAPNMYAAVDIASVKLKQQLKKYKEIHSGSRVHRRLFARLRSREV